jgi:predicted N-acetyltransferase YhbS
MPSHIWSRSSGRALSPRPGGPADAIVGGLAVDIGWRGIGIEEKLLGALKDEIAGRAVSEVAVIGYRLGDAPYLRAHGIRLVSRVAATFSIDLDVLDA